VGADREKYIGDIQLTHGVFKSIKVEKLPD
jgi:hypothetical protein